MKGLSIGITGSDRFLVGDLQSREALAKKVATSEIDHLFVADHISFHTGFGMDALINAATLSAMLPERLSSPKVLLMFILVQDGTFKFNLVFKLDFGLLSGLSIISALL